jgi:hypothetical protein
VGEGGGAQGFSLMGFCSKTRGVLMEDCQLLMVSYWITMVSTDNGD